MMQTEESRMNIVDRQELERHIKELERELDADSNKQITLFGIISDTPLREKINKELRRLRRLRE